MPSKPATSKWKRDKWSLPVTFYKDYNLTYRKTKDGEEEQRIISPTEDERLLGFPDDGTKPEEKDVHCKKESRTCEGTPPGMFSRSRW